MNHVCLLNQSYPKQIEQTITSINCWTILIEVCIPSMLYPASIWSKQQTVTMFERTEFIQNLWVCCCLIQETLSTIVMNRCLTDLLLYPIKSFSSQLLSSSFLSPNVTATTSFKCQFVRTQEFQPLDMGDCQEKDGSLEEFILLERNMRHDALRHCLETHWNVICIVC